MDEKKNTIIIITGPTASGKTALSLELAKHLDTSIISADSRQCFKELNIGVAKPTNEQLQGVKHYFINSHSIFENVNAQIFEDYALHAAAEIFTKNNFAVMAGGTGLYIKAFCEGLDEIPEINAETRKQVIDNYKHLGLQWLQNEISSKDPAFWEGCEKQNPQRLMRALEVIISTGRSITAYRKQEKKERPFRIIKVGLQISKEQLHHNINMRTAKMIDEGLIAEAKLLIKYKHLNALQTVGYSEMFAYLQEKISLDEAISRIKTNTMHYAKRQVTWFKKDPAIRWIKEKPGSSVKDLIQ